MLTAEALDLLVELVSFHFERPPQLLEPLDFPLKRLKVPVPHSFLSTKHMHTNYARDVFIVLTLGTRFSRKTYRNLSQ